MNKSLETKHNPYKAPQSSQDTIDQDKLAKSMVLRWFYIVLAWICICLGILGIFIPGLPTVDFIILATIFASKGSEKLYQWFLRNKYIGPLIISWQQERKIPKKAKWLSTFSMSIAASILIYTSIGSTVMAYKIFVYMAIICMILVLLWMWSKS